MHNDDTIVAIATPPGRGGLGVVRLSGADALTIARQLVRVEADPQPWHAALGDLLDDDGALVDQVILTLFRKPHSYTAEDVVEISCHGAPVVLRFLLGRAAALGARLAEPGEFTMRAFLNGRIDLPQAEAVRDLVEARTLYQARIAAQQMEGAVSRHIAPVKKSLVDLITLLEAGIDFAEDDVAVLPSADIQERIAPVIAALEAYADSFRTGRVVQNGLTLAIAGRPNVGKSSLFNRLVERDRAIVTAAPGTTRDLVTESVNIDGIPVGLVDTAGIRDAADEAESIGVRKSWEAVADADLVLVVLDASAGLSAGDQTLLERAGAGRPAVVVWNKTDLAAAPGLPAGAHKVSALTGRGIPELRRAILHSALPGVMGSGETGFLTNIRHERLIREALDALASARLAVAENLPHEMLLIDLYNALRPLDALTGETTVEDILKNIFSSFCIGK